MIGAASLSALGGKLSIRNAATDLNTPSHRSIYQDKALEGVGLEPIGLEGYTERRHGPSVVPGLELSVFQCKACVFSLSQFFSLLLAD